MNFGSEKGATGSDEVQSDDDHVDQLDAGEWGDDAAETEDQHVALQHGRRTHRAVGDAAEREITKPAWLLVTHLFNHQTHHRGQVHCMLTQSGIKPDVTDIPVMAG